MPSRLTDRESRRRQGTLRAVGLSEVPIVGRAVTESNGNGFDLSHDARDSPSNTKEAGRMTTSDAAGFVLGGIGLAETHQTHLE